MAGDPISVDGLARRSAAFSQPVAEIAEKGVANGRKAWNLYKVTASGRAEEARFS
jgi:Tfp pilus assembly protein PilX